jgi:hypothetical protein
LNARKAERKVMPIEFHFDVEKKAIFGTMSSPLTLDEYRSSIDAIVHSTEHPPNIRTLWDLRELDFSEIDRSFEERLISISEEFPERRSVKIAFIVKGDLGFGMLRMFETLADRLRYETKVFRNFSEGENWLLQE